MSEVMLYNSEGHPYRLVLLGSRGCTLHQEREKLQLKAVSED